MVNWLPDYHYRRKMIIAAGVGASTDFQYPVKFYAGIGESGSEAIGGLTGSKIYVESHCQASFYDVNFTSSDGTTELDHWKQDSSLVSGVSCVYWIKTPDATAAQSIYVYYGAGGGKSSQANTFVDVISGVVGAWNMEEANAADAVVDYSGNGNNGTPTGTDIVAGRFTGKKARSFNGVSDFVRITTNASLQPLTITMSCWVKMLSTPSSYIGIFDNVDSQKGYSIQNEGAGAFRFQIGKSGGWFNVDTSNFVNNQWYFLTLTYDGTTLKGYVNGGFINSAIGVLVPSTVDWSIGNSITYGNFANCSVNDAFIFDYDLNSTQILNLYNDYPDVSLDAGKVLVRRYASTTNPAHSTWSSEETLQTPIIGRQKEQEQRRKLKLMRKQQNRQNWITYLTFKISHPFITLTEQNKN